MRGAPHSAGSGEPIQSLAGRRTQHSRSLPYGKPLVSDECYRSLVAKDQGVYVEICIRSTVDEIWRRTQVPELHQQWDLRFTEIEYLPRLSESEPQRFLYSTRIGFGLKIEGEGESTGERADVSGTRTSALSFWAKDPKSLITKGSGYWKYVPAGASVRFLTWYDYHSRFGAIGKLFDRFVFRPLIAWATAWSFDRLRLWIEREIPPETSLRMALMHACARGCVAFIWLWQGIIPKLMFPSTDEKAMISAAGLSAGMLPAIGAAEALLGILALFLWRWRPFFVINAVLMLGALLSVALQSPSYLFAAFNPVTLNVAMIILSALGYLSANELPSAAHCLRRPPK
jgi:DoxX-like family